MPRTGKQPPLTSRQNPLVARCRAAARGELPNLLLVDGPHLVDAALTAGIRVDTALALEPSEDEELARIVRALEQRGVTVVRAAPAVMAAASPVKSPSAIVALAAPPAWTEAAVFRGTPLAVVACDVQDPGNLGAMVRVCEAAGATGLVAAGASADPLGWKALRGSMGSAFRMPVLRVADIARAAEAAAARGCRLIATVPRGGEPLYSTALTGPTALLIGSEGAGLPPDVIARCDARITIPMSGAIESLNAAVATALVVYEARRQRSSPPSHSGP